MPLPVFKGPHYCLKRPTLEKSCQIQDEKVWVPSKVSGTGCRMTIRISSLGRISWVRWRFRFSTGRSFRPESSSRSPRSTFRVIQSIPVYCFRAVVASVVASWTRGCGFSPGCLWFLTSPTRTCHNNLLNFNQKKIDLRNIEPKLPYLGQNWLNLA